MLWKKRDSKARNIAEIASDLVPTPVVAIDREFTVLFMNTAGAQVAGRPAAECAGMKCYDIFKTPHCRTEQCRCRQAMERRGAFTGDTVAAPQGQPIPIRYTGTPMLDESGAVVGAVEYVLDLTKETEITSGLTMLAKAATEGNLDARADAGRFEGNYRSIVEGVNTIMDTIVKPVRETSAVLERVAERDLTVRVTGEYHGDLARMKDSLNQAVENLDQALEQVSTAVGQVASAATQIGTGSQSLAQGASEQAGSLEEVSSSLQQLASTTRQNAGNAKEARSLAEGTRTKANKGVESMQRLSEAMEKIKNSSDSTAKIVKTIDEIAFQTNLLALNAAVEAARAGDAGKGFAVVAEEVRNLAMRSAEAAKNTANMIEESVHNAEAGVKMNQEVFERLQEITNEANKVGDVMGEIAVASEQQSQGIEQITTAVDQVNQVTQQNAANSEESASASEELSGQSEELKSLVSSFRLSSEAASNGRNGHASRVPKLEVMRPAGPKERYAA